MISKRALISMLAAVLVPLSLLLAACATPAATTPTAVSRPTPAPAATAASAATPAAAAKPATGSASLEQLYEAAKKEGQLVYNFGANFENFKPVIQTWEKKFPAVALKPLSVTSVEVPARIITEYGANRVSMDVTDSELQAIQPLVDRDLLVRYAANELGLKESDLLMDGRAVRTRTAIFVMIYNNKLVSEAEAPRTWEDLLNPRWKGKIAFRTSIPGLLGLPLAIGKEAATEYIKMLAKQEIKNYPSVEAIYDTVSRGEALIGQGTLNTTLDRVEKGLPLGVAAISPVRNTVSMAWGLKGAPHPNAARLLLAWLASPEGTAGWTASGYGAPYPPDASRESRLLAQKGMKVNTEDTVEKTALAVWAAQEFPKMLGFVAQ